MAEVKKEIAMFQLSGEYNFKNGNKLILTHYASGGASDDNLVVVDKDGNRLWGVSDTYRYGGVTNIIVYEDESFFFNTFFGCAYTMDPNTFEVLEKHFFK